jgi:hypothetical protein
VHQLVVGGVVRADRLAGHWNFTILVHNVGVMSGTEFGIPNSEAVELAWDWTVIRSNFL